MAHQLAMPWAIFGSSERSGMRISKRMIPPMIFRQLVMRRLRFSMRSKRATMRCCSRLAARMRLRLGRRIILFGFFRFLQASATTQGIGNEPLQLAVDRAKLVLSPTLQLAHRRCIDAQHETLLCNFFHAMASNGRIGSFGSFGSSGNFGSVLQNSHYSHYSHSFLFALSSFLVVQSACIDHRRCGLVSTQYDQEV